MGNLYLFHLHHCDDEDRDGRDYDDHDHDDRENDHHLNACAYGMHPL